MVEEKLNGGMSNLEKSVAQKIKYAIEQELGEMEEVSITPQELRALLSQDNKRKMRQYIKRAGSAAAILLVLFSVAWFFPVKASKNIQEVIISQGGKDWITNGEQQEQVQTEEIFISRMDEVKKYQKEYPILIDPANVIDHFVFENLKLLILDGKLDEAVYTFCNKKNETLSVMQKIDAKIKRNTAGISFDDKKIINARPVYISKDGDRTTATYATKKYTIVISGTIKTKALLELVRNLDG